MDALPFFNYINNWKMWAKQKPIFVLRALRSPGWTYSEHFEHHASRLADMIVLFTDYGWQGPYIGQIEARLYRESPRTRTITLFADVPRQNPKAAAYLLAAHALEFPRGSIFFCVVDPGVGTFNDHPVVLRMDDRWYVGPDNGVFDIVTRRAEKVESWKIHWRPERLSASFHGRDLYAPVCAMIANGLDIPGEKMLWQDRHQWPDDLDEIIYIDGFGNCMTGYRAVNVAKEARILIAGRELSFATTFGKVAAGTPFWFENSCGLAEIAVNCGDAAGLLDIVVGTELRFI